MKHIETHIHTNPIKTQNWKTGYTSKRPGRIIIIKHPIKLLVRSFCVAHLLLDMGPAPKCALYSQWDATGENWPLLSTAVSWRASQVETGLCTLPLSVLDPAWLGAVSLVFSAPLALTISPLPVLQRVFFFPLFNEAEGSSAKNEMGGGVGVVKPFGEKSGVNEQGCKGRTTAASVSQKPLGKMYKMPAWWQQSPREPQTSYSLGRVQAGIISLGLQHSFPRQPSPRECAHRLLLLPLGVHRAVVLSFPSSATLWYNFLGCADPSHNILFTMTS